MSSNDNKNDTDKEETKPSDHEEHTDTITVASVENISKTDTVLSIDETTLPNKEIIIDIESVINKNINFGGKIIGPNELGKQNGNNPSQIRPPKSTWVMFTGRNAAPLPDGESPLSYDSSRNDFVRLVFIIVLIMIMLTAAFVAFVLFTDFRDTFADYRLYLIIPAIITLIALNYAIACLPCTRMFPCNIICLVLAVIAMSIVAGYITMRYRTEVVFYALMATCVVVMVCLALACTSFDFTAFFLYIVVISAAFGAVVMMFFLYMMISGTYMKTAHLIILLIGTLLNSVIFTMELQMVLGGRTVELGETDYALGAFLLYTSIVDIFLKLVQILGALDE